jgi:hypothetical protein
MRIIAFTLSYWNTREDACRLAEDESYFGLRAWYGRTHRLLYPEHMFIASGTWSEPSWCPLPALEVVNAGVFPTDQPHDPVKWNYAGPAFTAALAHACNRSNWDLLVLLDTDTLVGAVDFDSLLREFLSRPEEVLGLSWDGTLGMTLAWKPAGAARYLHQRRRANLIDWPGEAMLLEEEFSVIHEGRWWNPWPHLATVRQDHGHKPEAHLLNEAAMSWPFVRLPHPDIVKPYLALNRPLPVKLDLPAPEELYGAAPKIGFK